MAALKRAVWNHYKKARRDFPWRTPELTLLPDGSVDPYKILVSEVMLQQTQAGARTIEKYRAFIKAFPTTKVLARASLSEVYALWQGLGYNRRAKALRDAAILVEKEFKGTFPAILEDLERLPGVGPYTASAVYVFAYNKPTALIETNIRTVFIHHLFKDREGITDAQLLPYITEALPPQRARDWYSALMDYGAHLKKEIGNVSRRSAHYVRQSAFKGSNREIRGKLLRELLKGRATLARLGESVGAPLKQVEGQLKALIKEGFVVKRGERYELA